MAPREYVLYVGPASGCVWCPELAPDEKDEEESGKDGHDDIEVVEEQE